MTKTIEDAAKILLEHSWTLEEINIVLGISDPVEKDKMRIDAGDHFIEFNTDAVSSQEVYVGDEDYPDHDWNQPALRKPSCGFTPLR